MIKERLIKARIDRINKICSEQILSVRPKTTLRDMEIILNTLSGYLTYNIKRASFVNTILYRSEAVPLDEIYVETTFDMRTDKNTQKIIHEQELLSKIRCGGRVIITGSGGCGKTIFLKKIFMCNLIEKWGYCPFFLELRYLNLTRDDNTVISFLTEQLRLFDTRFGSRHLQIILENATTLLMFDAFDEIEERRSAQIEENLAHLFAGYANSAIVLTSRPLQNIRRISDVDIYSVSPLPLDKAATLVGKLRFPSETKEKFIEQLPVYFNNKEHIFFQSPLLLTLMFCVFEATGEIPTKMPIFYEQSFDILYHRHDATKGSYSRESKSGLDLHDFKSVFSAFCFITYLRQKFSFSKDIVLGTIKESTNINNIDVGAEAILSDLQRRVCLIVEDSGIYEFSHRAFQEYFTALYIIRSESINRGEIFDYLASMRRGDQVITMAHFLNKEFIEENWLLPQLEIMLNAAHSKKQILFKSVQIKLIQLNKDDILHRMDGPIKIDQMRVAYIIDSSVGIVINVAANQTFSRIISVLNKIFPEKFERIRERYRFTWMPYDTALNWQGGSGSYRHRQYNGPPDLEIVVQKEAESLEEAVIKTTKDVVSEILRLSQNKSERLGGIVNSAIQKEKNRTKM